MNEISRNKYDSLMSEGSLDHCSNLDLKFILGYESHIWWYYCLKPTKRLWASFSVQMNMISFDYSYSNNVISNKEKCLVENLVE